MKKATYRDKDLIVDILAKSFDTNQSVNYIVKQDNRRLQRIKALMDYSFEVCYLFGDISSVLPATHRSYAPKILKGD